MLGQLARIAIQMVSVVVLARLLTPAEYGTFALALAVVALGEAFRDFGLSSAAIQAKTLSRDQQSNLFWVNSGIGVVLAIACVLGSPIMAHVTGDAQSPALLQVMASVFILNGVVSQYRASLNRDLRFEALVLSDVSGPVLGVASAICLAVAGWGVWALVAQQVIGALVTTIVAVICSRWLPRLPNRRGDIRGMLRFGLGMFGTQIIGYFNIYVDTLTIGLRLGTTQLGIYDRAYQVLMRTLNQFRNPTMSVALPILSKLEPGSEECDRMILRGQAALGYTFVAGTALAAGAAGPLIHLFLGPQWVQSVPIFAVLAVAGAFSTIGYVSSWIYVSRALTSKLFLYSCISLAIKASFVLIGSSWGILGVAIGYAASPIVGLPLSYLILSRWTPVPIRALFGGALRIVICAVLGGAAAAGVVMALAGLPDLVQVVLAALALVAVYALVALVSRSVRSDILGVLEFGRRALTARRVRV